MLVPIELSSMLVVGSAYRNKHRIPQQELERLSFSPTALLRSTQSKYRNNWFSYVDRKGRIIRVTAFELARVLLVHNSHLVRAAFRPQGLDSLASLVAIDDAMTEIRFGPMTDFPASNLKNEGIAKHLTWLFMNSDVKRSFHSIYESWQCCEHDDWTFNFSPPPLTGMTFTLSGKYRKGSRSDFVVREIVGIRFPEFQTQSSVDFVHPRLNETENRSANKTSTYERLASDGDPDLDLQATVGTTKRRHKMNDSRLAISFAGTPSVKLKTKGTSVISGLSQGTGKKEEAGVGHASPGGTAQEFDHALNRAVADDREVNPLQESAPTSRFRAFEEIVARVANGENFKLFSTGCYSMPVLEKGSKAVTQTVSGRPIQYHLASMAFEDQNFILIEVDTESMKKPRSLSTLVLGFNADPMQSLRKIISACSSAGIKWPMDIIQELCYLVTTCNHPSRTIRNSGGVARSPEEYKSAWVEIIRRRVKQAYADL